MIESGATDHMIPILSALNDFEAGGGEVKFGDNNLRLNILGRGDTPLLSQILLVEGLSFGLISISRLDREGNISIFEGGRVAVYDYCDDELLTGTLRGNLYHLDDHYRDILLSNSTHPDNSSDPEYAARASKVPVPHRSIPNVPISYIHRPKSATIGLNLLELLHARWGHANEYAIKRAIRLKSILGAGATYDQIKYLHTRYCEECYKGKMRAFSRKTSVSTKI
jgi:hypothetical protein